MIGESKTVEFKTSFQKEVIESVVAFNNTKGGNLIGVKDNGEIVGITSLRGTKQSSCCMQEFKF